VAEIAGKPTDHVQLPVIGAQAALVLQRPTLKVVADAGYHDQKAVAATEAAGLESYVPRPEKGGAKRLWSTRLERSNFGGIKVRC